MWLVYVSTIEGYWNHNSGGYKDAEKTERVKVQRHRERERESDMHPNEWILQSTWISVYLIKDWPRRYAEKWEGRVYISPFVIELIEWFNIEKEPTFVYIG
jgi:hypothetical protein